MVRFSTEYGPNVRGSCMKAGNCSRCMTGFFDACDRTTPTSLSGCPVPPASPRYAYRSNWWTTSSTSFKTMLDCSVLAFLETYPRFAPVCSSCLFRRISSSRDHPHFFSLALSLFAEEAFWPRYVRIQQTTRELSYEHLPCPGHAWSHSLTSLQVIEDRPFHTFLLEPFPPPTTLRMRQGTLRGPRLPPTRSLSWISSSSLSRTLSPFIPANYTASVDNPHDDPLQRPIARR